MEQAMGYEILSQTEQHCGKTIKTYLDSELSTKRQVEWKLQISGKPTTVILQLSSLSGKKRVLVDGSSILQIKNFASTFKHSFVHNDIRIEVLVEGEKAELFLHQLRRNTYVDAFLALSNQFSGEIVDVYKENKQK